MLKMEVNRSFRFIILRLAILKNILILKELFEGIIEFKYKLCACNKYHKLTRDTPRDKLDYGHFMFSFQRDL